MPINDTLTKQNLVDQLKSLRTTYKNESGLMSTTLDNTHHALVMREYGENKQLKECLTKINELILAYDTTAITVKFDLNGASAGVAPADMVEVEGASITLPAAPTGLIPPEGKVFFGWNTLPDGKGVGYKAGASYIVTDKNVTLYAYY